MNMFSPKLIGIVLVVLVLIGGNVALLMKNTDLSGQVDALSEALTAPSAAEETLERANAELSEQLSKAKEETERLQARSAKTEELLASQRKTVADLELKVKAYEAEREATSEAEESSAAAATTGSTVEPLASASGQDIVHVVRRGELLRQLADRYYGDPNQWQRILDANRGTVTDPRSLIPGMELIIPGPTQP